MSLFLVSYPHPTIGSPPVFAKGDQEKNAEDKEEKDDKEDKDKKDEENEDDAEDEGEEEEEQEDPETSGESEDQDTTQTDTPSDSQDTNTNSPSETNQNEEPVETPAQEEQNPTSSNDQTDKIIFEDTDSQNKNKERSRAPPVAHAGEDTHMAAGRSLTLDGSLSSGENVSFQWHIFSGPGFLTDSDSATPTLTIPADAAQNSVTVTLIVTDDTGTAGSDEVYIHIHLPVAAQTLSQKIVGTWDNILVEEFTTQNHLGQSQTVLKIGNKYITLPDEDSDDFSLSHDAHTAMLGLPQAFNNRGGVYFWDLEKNHLTEKQGNKKGDAFGKFLLADDLDLDGRKEHLISSPGASDFGMLFIYDETLELLSEITGTETYPLRSVMVLASTEGKVVVLGPDNPALNPNLNFLDSDGIQTCSHLVLLDANGILDTEFVLDEANADAVIDVGEDIFAMAAGDVNGDLQNDLVIGDKSGTVWIFWGPFDPNKDLTENDAALKIFSSNQVFISPAIQTGDVNGDGDRDIILGLVKPEENSRRIGVVFGMEVWDEEIDLQLHPKTMILGNDSDDLLATDLLLADTDEDGVSEILAYNKSGPLLRYNLADQKTVLEQESGGQKVETFKPSAGGFYLGCGLNPTASVHLDSLVVMTGLLLLWILKMLL